MNKILEYLEVTQEEYENMYLGAYMRWCESVCLAPSEFQNVLANASISKYYNTELAKCEAEFVKLFSRYENSETVSAKDAKNLYCDCTFKMFNIRPMVLLSTAKKIKVYAN